MENRAVGMRLSLAIPVWNDIEGVRRLVRQAAELGVFEEVVVVDDASDKPVKLTGLVPEGAFPGGLKVVRVRGQKGAGHARNRALQRVTGTHVIFFDSDDLFGGDFPQIVALAAERSEPFDFLIFRHDDSRCMGEGKPGGTFPTEEEHWRAVGAEVAPTLIDRAKASRLVQLSAYPWNKIYRTEFLREKNLRCTELMVHNDLELHWTGFVAAEKILVTRLVGAVHHVAETGSRLTNRRSKERLEVFSALANVLARIEASVPSGGLEFLVPFARFSWNLLGWIEANLDPEHAPELGVRARRFFMSHLKGPHMTLLAHGDPALARRVVRFVMTGSRR